MWSLMGVANRLIYNYLAAMPDSLRTDQKHGRAGFDGNQEHPVTASDARKCSAHVQLDNFP